MIFSSDDEIEEKMNKIEFITAISKSQSDTKEKARETER